MYIEYSATLIDLHHTAELSCLLTLFVTFLSHHHYRMELGKIASVKRKKEIKKEKGRKK
jgi:hypothetical protein